MKNFLSKFLLCVTFLLCGTAHAQQVMVPAYQSSSGTSPIITSATTPLPVRVYGGTNGQCLVSNGTYGVFNTCGGGGTITLGTSSSATNPQRNGQAGTGFYSDTTNEVEVGINGVNADTFSSTAETLSALNFSTVALTAATSGSTQVASPTIGLTSNAWNSSSASQAVPMTMQFTAMPGTNLSNALLDFEMPVASGAFEALTEVRFNGVNSYINIINANDSLGAFFGETYSTLQFGLKSNSGGPNAYFGISSSGQVETLAGGFGNPTIDTVLDDNSSGHKMGVNTSSPASTLSVKGGVAIGTTYAGSNAAASNNLIVQGAVGIGTTSPATGAYLDVRGPIKMMGYTVGTLPTASVGDIAYVTDQMTTCAIAGGALTGGGSVTCPVFYNGSAWVGN